jgi:hypothetical protein
MIIYDAEKKQFGQFVNMVKRVSIMSGASEIIPKQLGKSGNNQKVLYINKVCRQTFMVKPVCSKAAKKQQDVEYKHLQCNNKNWGMPTGIPQFTV